MLVSIGILAHNEASRIGQLIGDLASQDIYDTVGVQVSVVVVANGCSDDTVNVAGRVLRSAFATRANVSFKVESLTVAGKANAWNEFVHNIASTKTDYIVMLDADIRIPEETTLGVVVKRLACSPTAVIAVDESVKDVALQASKTFFDRLVLAGSGTAHDPKTAVAGAMYTARYNVVRTIWMPLGLPGEDGFLRAMLCTRNFTEPDDPDRVVFADGARHIFESEKSLYRLFKHNIRLTIGTAINVMLFKHFVARVQIERDLGKYIRDRNADDPKWINTIVQQEMKDGKYFLIDKSFLWKRPRRFWQVPLRDKVVRLPIYIIGFMFDCILYFQANRMMRRGAGAGYW